MTSEAELPVITTSVTPTEAGLHGTLGTRQLVLSVMSYLAPLAAAAGYLSLVIGFGNGLGAPLIFLMCGGMFLIFAVGYTAMVRHVENPGAFYAYVTAGLGKRAGLASALLSITFYTMTATGFFVFGGLAAKAVVEEYVPVSAPWWLYALIYLVIVGACAYRGLEFNARILGLIVLLEVAIIAVFNVVTFMRGGSDGLQTGSFTYDAFTNGSIAVGSLFAISVYAGFEATAVFREEVRDPVRTISRATYIVVVVISLFYALTAWMLIAALGRENAVGVSEADPSAAFDTAMSAMVGSFMSDVVALLVVMSVLASQLAIANVTSRYLYCLGVDRVLPSALAGVHHRHVSPHIAAVTYTVVTGLGVATVLIFGLEPKVAYGVFGGVVVYAFEILAVLVSVAVLVYFRRRSGAGESPWKVVVAPIVSVIIFGWLFVYSVAHRDLLIGVPTHLTEVLLVITVVVPVAGVLYASWLRRSRPETYVRIGRVPH